MTPDGDLIEDFLAHLATIRSPRTVRTYGRILWAAHRELPYGVPTAKREEIADWLARPELRTDHSRRTYLAALRSFAAWAVASGHLNRNEPAGIRRPRAPESLPNPCTDQQLATILAGAREPLRTWSVVAAYAGARRIEISRLRREHVDQRSVLLHGKGDRLRRVPTHPLLWAAVAPLPAGPVAGGLDADQLGHQLRTEFLRLGQPVTPHQLRHWYGTTLVAEGAGIEEVQRLMGHSRITTTLGYVLVASPRLVAAVARLPDLVTAAAAAGPDPAVAAAAGR